MNLKGIKKPTHKSSNYAYWKCGYAGYGDEMAEKLTKKLQDKGFNHISTKYHEGRVSVHAYF